MNIQDSIRVEGVTKVYGNTVALCNVDITFKKGKIYGLLGRNGAGKSTLLKLITNRAFASEGNVFINGESVTENPRIREWLFYMTEENFYGNIKLKKILHTTAEFYPGFDLQKALKYCDEFGIDISKKFSALSTGYKNILKLIITLCQDLPYLIFDEPVVGLDAYHRELFYRLLMECYGEGERTIILATHLIEEVQSIVEDVVVVDKGKVLLFDSVENLTSKGYSVAGTPQAVNEFIKGKNVVDRESISGMEIAYIMGEGLPSDAPQNLTFSTLNLQKIFVKLTGGSEHE